MGTPINLRTDNVEQAWGIDHRYINMVKDSKGALEVAALKSWSQFPRYEEDLLLRDRTKWAKYDGKLPIMRIMTNV